MRVYTDQEDAPRGASARRADNVAGYGGRTSDSEKRDDDHVKNIEDGTNTAHYRRALKSPEDSRYCLLFADCLESNDDLMSLTEEIACQVLGPTQGQSHTKDSSKDEARVEESDESQAEGSDDPISPSPESPWPEALPNQDVLTSEEPESFAHSCAQVGVFRFRHRFQCLPRSRPAVQRSPRPLPS